MIAGSNILEMRSCSFITTFFVMNEIQSFFSEIRGKTLRNENYRERYILVIIFMYL